MSVHNEIENVRQQLSFIEKELTSVQAKYDEKKSPWYKNAGIIISLLALFFSSATGLYSIFRQKTADALELRQKCLDYTLQLYQLRDQRQGLQDKIDSGKSKSITEAFQDQEYDLENKIKIILVRLEDVDRQIPQELSCDEYKQIGQICQGSGQPIQGVYFYQKGLAVSKNYLDTFSISMGLSELYFVPNITRDTAAGLRYLRLAENTFLNRPGSNFKKLLTDVYLHGATMYNGKNNKLRDMYVAKAKAVISSFPASDDDLKQETIEDLNDLTGDFK
jgi:hypothetical protein